MIRFTSVYREFVNNRPVSAAEGRRTATRIRQQQTDRCEVHTEPTRIRARKKMEGAAVKNSAFQGWVYLI